MKKWILSLILLTSLSYSQITPQVINIPPPHKGYKNDVTPERHPPGFCADIMNMSIDKYGNVIGLVSFRISNITTFRRTGVLPQNVNYALKSSFLLAVLESLPEIALKLKEPHISEKDLEEFLVSESKESIALILVY